MPRRKNSTSAPKPARQESIEVYEAMIREYCRMRPLYPDYRSAFQVLQEVQRKQGPKPYVDNHLYRYAKYGMDVPARPYFKDRSLQEIGRAYDRGEFDLETMNHLGRKAGTIRDATYSELTPEEKAMLAASGLFLLAMIPIRFMTNLVFVIRGPPLRGTLMYGHIAIRPYVK